ncbi:MAG TPA: sigma-70 family RNA polymerase sigma factor [Phycisphaerales bacterium]|nr:sigma-70 family RNA polymerase sigma factor [Phycisphaerales bacterium]
MTTPAPHEVTQLLNAISGGDSRASAELLPLVYEELRKLARSYMARESAAQTLQPTALVHEAYIRLLGGQDLGWDSRGHFFGAAAMAMRRILVERARARGRIKRGGDRARVELGDEPMREEPTGTDLLALDEALDKLQRYDPRKCEVVMLRYFAGLGVDETAAAMGLSSATVRNEWTFARAWLLRTMSGAAEPAT